MRYIAALCLSVTATLVNMASAGLRCDGSLVTVGDRRFDVLAACGPPDLRIPVHELIGPYRVLPYEELWYYNFGPNRFIRELRFQSSRLVSMRSRGYGFRAEMPGSCTPQDLRRGMTVLELHARCGDPDARELQVLRLRHFPPGHEQVVLEEEWFYDFGPNRFYRVVTLADGRVTRVESGRRGR